MNSDYMMKQAIRNEPTFRPPAEAGSLILQIDEGCPWNQCTFCGMYKSTPYRRRTLDEVETLIVQQARLAPQADRIFLADGDPLRRPASEMIVILETLLRYFSQVKRINAYATGSSIMSKTDENLRHMRSLRMHTLYMGLESGDDATLERSAKQENAATMIEAGVRARESGLRMSVMILLGLAGKRHSHDHIAATVQALQKMQPRLLSCLRAVPVPGTVFDEAVRSGEIIQLTEYEIVKETRALVAQLELSGTVFRANHSSNVLPLEGRLSRDRPRLLAQLDQVLSSGTLDRKSAGPQPFLL